MTTRRTRRVNKTLIQPMEEQDFIEEDYAAPEPDGLSRDEVAYARKMDWLPDDAWEAPAPGAEIPDAEAAQDWDAEPEEEDLPEDEGYVPLQMDGYDPLYQSETDYDDDEDPLDDDLLTEEEQAELRRSHWQLLANLADLAGVILGTLAILLLVTLLVSLLNWLVNDMSQSFILLQKHL